MMSSSWPNKAPSRGRRTVFLDRDGVINRDSPAYVTTWDRFEFLPGSLDAIAALTAAAIDTIIITNQSAVARGLMPPETLADIHARLCHAVSENGGRIRAIFHCPHHPTDGCDCRKPRPGMILQARDRYGLDLKQTIMIGDRATDIVCGRQAGCGATILVRSGLVHSGPVRSGLEDERLKLERLGVRADHIASDLAAAVRFIKASLVDQP